MPTGYSTQLTRQIGEHLVVAKLGRMGILATPFAGNVPDYDLIASDISGNTLPLQVKAINGPSWQFAATTFLEIEFDGNCQNVRGKKQLLNPGLVCIFVLLKPDEHDEFYILTKRNVQDHFFTHYPGGIRPKNPKSVHCAVWPREPERYKDNWKLVTKHLDPIK